MLTNIGVLITNTRNPLCVCVCAHTHTAAAAAAAGGVAQPVGGTMLISNDVFDYQLEG